MSFQSVRTYTDLYPQVVQRRGDWGEPRVNFSRSWADYREGFGDRSGEFWIGNKWLHR